MKEVETIVIATRNPAKIERYSKLFRGYAKQIIGLADLNISDKPIETGETAEENSELKARFYAEKSGMLVFSEDEALYVDFLPNESQPGVHVRRINGRDEVDDDELLSHWERLLSRVDEEKRTGRWHIAYALAYPDGKVKSIALDHPILFFYPSSEIRLPGWPMSSLQGPKLIGKPHSELTKEEKIRMEKITNSAVLEKLKDIMNSE